MSLQDKIRLRSYLFVFGGAMGLEEASARRRRELAVLGKDFHLARLSGFRRRFGVSLPLDHYIENRGRLVPSNGEAGFLVASLEVIQAPGFFVSGSLIQMSDTELGYMDTLEHVNQRNLEAGFMKRIDVTDHVDPLPEDADCVFAFTGTAESRRLYREALARGKAGIPAYYLKECLAAISNLQLVLHPEDELLKPPNGIREVEMHWEQ